MKSHLHQRRRGSEESPGAASAPCDGPGAGQAGKEAPSRPRESHSAIRRRAVTEHLFSADAKKQFAALKAMAAANGISRRQYHRIDEIRRTTSHLLIAELAEHLLHDKVRPDQISVEARREAISLFEESEELRRRRLLQMAQKPPEITLARKLLVRWLAGAVAAGFLLGAVLAYLALPRASAHAVSEADTAYIDTRTGRLASFGSESEKAEAQRGDADGHYRKAYYCWKCRQWLPLSAPKKSGDATALSAQALSDRAVGGSQAAPVRRHP